MSKILKDIVDIVEWENVRILLMANSGMKNTLTQASIFEYMKRKTNITTIELSLIVHNNFVLGFTKDKKYLIQENIIDIEKDLYGNYNKDCYEELRTKKRIIDPTFQQELDDGYRAVILKLNIDEILSAKIHKNFLSSHSAEELVSLVILGCN